MIKNIGLVWVKDDFRVKKNNALSEATKKHDQVVAFYLYKNKKFKNKFVKINYGQKNWALLVER